MDNKHELRHNQAKILKSILQKNMEEKYGVMVCGHGSRDEDAVIEFLNFAKKLKNKLLRYELDWGFLEFANPVIKSGLAVSYTHLTLPTILLV